MRSRLTLVLGLCWTCLFLGLLPAIRDIYGSNVGEADSAEHLHGELSEEECFAMILKGEGDEELSSWQLLGADKTGW